jgi:ParB family chromosome partitioning protein
MGKRVSLSSLADAPTEDVPGHSTATLIRLRPAQIAATPLNPRANFGTDKELAELGESMRVRQLQPVVAVSRARYLALWPDHEDHAGAADYVLANGERRYRAAVHVGLERLDVIVREEIADSRAAFLDALLSENLDRRNFDPIEEALAVEAMVHECGTANAAATRFRRHETWVSQRRALLKLAPGMQHRVRTGEVPVRIARSVAALPHDEQESAWLRARAEQAQETQQRARQRQPRSPRENTPAPETGRPAPQPPDPDGTGQREIFTAVKTGDGAEGPATTDPGAQAGQREIFTAVKTGDGAEDPPSTNPGAQARPAAAAMPWDSPADLARLIREHVAPEHITALIGLLHEAGR